MVILSSYNSMVDEGCIAYYFTKQIFALSKMILYLFIILLKHEMFVCFSKDSEYLPMLSNPKGTLTLMSDNPITLTYVYFG